MPFPFRKDRMGDAAMAVYTPIVAQSRHPRPYREWGIADTVTGRFDLLSLHMALVLHRLRGEPRAGRFAQALFDLFFRDMDRSLREMGVGDLSVPRRIARMTEMFYGLLASVGEALDRADSEALTAALSRNVFATEPNAAPELAAYCAEQAAFLASQSADYIVAGRLEFAPSDDEADDDAKAEA